SCGCSRRCVISTSPTKVWNGWTSSIAVARSGEWRVMLESCLGMGVILTRRGVSQPCRRSADTRIRAEAPVDLSDEVVEVHDAETGDVDRDVVGLAGAGVAAVAGPVGAL